MIDDPDDLTYRMLDAMRDSHAAAVAAVHANMHAVARLMDQVGTLIGKVDSIDARLIAFQADINKALCAIQSDAIATESRNTARREETPESVNHMRDIGKFVPKTPIGY